MHHPIYMVEGIPSLACVTDNQGMHYLPVFSPTQTELNWLCLSIGVLRHHFHLVTPIHVQYTEGHVW